MRGHTITGKPHLTIRKGVINIPHKQGTTSLGEAVMNAGASTAPQAKGRNESAHYETSSEFEGDGAIGANKAYGNMAGNVAVKMGEQVAAGTQVQQNRR